MGLFRGSFNLLVGMGCCIYVAQNYNLPNVKELFNTYVFLAKHIEETYRKPKKDTIDAFTFVFPVMPGESKYS